MPKSVIFVDSRVADYQSLIDSFTEPAEVFVLSGDSDGLDQMAAYLQGQNGIDAIHVISHGRQGALYLGSTVLDSSNLASRGSQLAGIGGALTETGDILLYGCNVAQGDVGLQFITSLAQYTGADVAASSDATGTAALGGDWVLEAVTGAIEAPALQGGEMAGLLAANTAPSFAIGTGKITTGLGVASDDYGYSIKVQADGKILLGGFAYYSSTAGSSSYALARYNSDGSLDTSFDGDGKAFDAFMRISGNGYSVAVAVQADGKILIGGDPTGPTLARYNTDGSRDPGFGIDGRFTIDGRYIGSGYGVAVQIQSDGKILLGGSLGSTTDSTIDFVLARVNSDGGPDMSFGGDGMVTTDFGVTNDSVKSIAIQMDGKILVGGFSTNNTTHLTSFALARYNSDGSLDTSFDGDGKVTTDFVASTSSRGYSVTTLSDGKILLAGIVPNSLTGSYDFGLARYNSNGTLDTSFDSDGKLITDIGVGTDDYCTSVTVLADGKILLGGWGYTAGRTLGRFVLTRYNSDGSLDTGFDGDGKVTTDFGTASYAEAYSVAIQADGKILLGGSVVQKSGTGTRDFALARYNSDGSLDGTFSNHVNTLYASPTYVENSSAVVLDSNVGILDAELSAQNSYGGAFLTLVRHNGASAQDVFTAKSGGTLSILLQSSYFAVDGVTIGRVTANSSGTLTLTFNANATQSLMNKAMQQIAYTNTSDAPPATVQIDWTFNDGNAGEQGAGGALSVTGNTTVRITAVNDPPVLSVPLIDQTLTANTAFSYTVPASSFTDPDLEALTYSAVMVDGTGMPPWVSFSAATRTFSGIPGTGDIGSIDIRVTAKDNANASVSDVVRLTVTAATNQTSTGSTGNDSLTSGAGNDSIDGGAGTDAVIYSGSRSSFSLTKTNAGFTVTDSTGAAGTDTLLNVERIKFADGAIALDVGATQPAGQTAMLLGAALPGRLAFDSSKQALLGAAIDLFDQGYSLQTLSGAVMRLPIWDILTGKATPTSTDVATYLLTNVNGVAPDATTLADAIAALNTETSFATQGNFLWHLAESTANQTHVGLVGLASTGLAYTV